MKVQNILIDKMIIFFNAGIITLYIKELRLLGKIQRARASFLIFLKKGCVTYITIVPVPHPIHTDYTHASLVHGEGHHRLHRLAQRSTEKNSSLRSE